MTIQDSLEELSKPIKQVREEWKEKAVTTFPKEVAISHAEKNLGVHLRDDGAIEIFAGKARIILDEKSGSIILEGTSIITNSSTTNINCTEKNSFGINGIPLSSDWVSPKPKGFLSLGKDGQLTENSPLTFKQWGAGGMEVLVGVPKEGQRSVKLTDIIDQKPLFHSKEQAFLNALTELLDDI